MITLIKYAILLYLITISFCHASDDIYQYINSKGQLVFTNKPPQIGAQKVKLPPLNIYANPMTKQDLQASNYIWAGNSTYTNGVEKNKKLNAKFDNQELERHKILTEELKLETIALNDAKQALLDGKTIKFNSEATNKLTYANRTQALEDAIKEHKKNIELLNKQLNY